MTNDVQRAWDIMKSLDFCFLVSNTGEGLRSRPMSSIVMHEEEKIYFLSNAAADQLDDILADPMVLLNYGNGSNQFVSASAAAVVTKDRALIKRLWNAGAQAFWPEGPDKADVCVITTTPHAAEFWDGPSGVVSFAKLAVSLVTGSQPDMGDNRKVAL